jgi:DNA-binding transcriptional ArsR family regulator
VTRSPIGNSSVTILLVDVFAALADPVRRDILRALAAGPARVVDLAATHPISRPAVSRHLRVLTEAGLVAGEDRGRERHYRIETAGLTAVDELLAELRPAAARPPIGEAALDALETEVRRTTRERRRRPGTERRQETA